MHVPDSITIGPVRSTMPRLHQHDDQVPVRMEVPDRLRPGFEYSILSFILYYFIFILGGNGSMILLNDTDFFVNGESNHLSDSFIHQPSLPSTLHPKDIETTSDDDYTSVHIKSEHQPNKIADSYEQTDLQ
jgi:hypothetical protein